MHGGTPLLGRAQELAELDARLDELAQGRGGLVLLEGEPGIGKTRLSDEVCARARSRGFVVARGAALADAGAPALGPFRALARALDPAMLSILDGQSDPRQSEVDDARWHRFDAFAEGLLRRAQDKPLVLVLDDLHDADPASLELLLFLMRQVRDGRWLFVGTLRDEATRASPANDMLLSRLAREGRTLWVKPLGVDDVGALSLRTKQAAGLDAARLHALTGGNPLFLGEVLSLVERGGQLSEARVPASIGAALGARLDALGTSARQAVDAAAVLGGAPTLPALARVLGVGADAVLQRVAEPIRAGVLVDDSSLRLRFAHPLMREWLLDQMSRPTRAALHFACAHALESLSSSGLDVATAEIAQHRAAALPLGDAHEAVAWLSRAADDADRRVAIEEAERLRARATEVADFISLDACARCDLELAHAHSLSRLGARARARDSAMRAASLARAAGDSRRLALSALAHGADFSLGVVDLGLVEDLEAAASALDAGAEGALLARVEARLAAALQPASDPQGPLDRARAAVLRARRAGDEAALLDTLLSAGSALADYAPLSERIALAREMVAIAVRLGQRPVALRGHLRLAIDKLEAGDLSGCDASIDAYDQLAATFGPRHYHWTSPLLRALRASIHGQFAEAERFAEQGREIGEASEDRNAAVAYAMQRFARARDTADRQGMFDTLEGAARAMHGQPGCDLWLALMRADCLARSGDVEALQVAFDALPREHPLIRSEPVAAALAIEITASLPRPDRAFAASLRDFMLPLADRCASWGVMMLAWDGPWLRYIGLGQRVCGELDTSVQSLEGALAWSVTQGAKPAALWASIELAESLRMRGRSEDLERAKSLTQEVAQGAFALGMKPLSDRAARAMRAVSEGSLSEKASHAIGGAPAMHFELRQDGEAWTLLRGDRVLRLKDSRGLRMLDRLIREAGREVHVLELSGAGDQTDAGDAGEALDARAIASYRERTKELRLDLEDAEERRDLARAERLREELEALTEQLAQGLGLGGRSRRAASSSERARVNVQRRLKDALDRIHAVDPELGTHLARCVRTGAFCSYQA